MISDIKMLWNNANNFHFPFSQILHSTKFKIRKLTLVQLSPNLQTLFTLLPIGITSSDPGFNSRPNITFTSHVSSVPLIWNSSSVFVFHDLDTLTLLLCWLFIWVPKIILRWRKLDTNQWEVLSKSHRHRAMYN